MRVCGNLASVLAAYLDPFDRVISTAGRGLDVWFLCRGVQAVVLEGQHPPAYLVGYGQIGFVIAEATIRLLQPRY